jgi:hypothetical protein
MTNASRGCHGRMVVGFITKETIEIPSIASFLGIYLEFDISGCIFFIRQWMTKAARFATGNYY